MKVWDSCNLPIPIEGFAQRGILDHFMPKESSNMISLWLYRHGGRLGELLGCDEGIVSVECHAVEGRDVLQLEAVALWLAVVDSRRRGRR